MASNHLLVVEDDYHLRSLIIKDIKKWLKDYSVEGTDSVVNAKRILKSNKKRGYITRVVIVDEVLTEDINDTSNPRGSELLTYINRVYPGICKIMLTSRARFQDIGKAINDGELNKYIQKSKYEKNKTILKTAIIDALSKDKRDPVFNAVTEILSYKNDKKIQPIIIAAGNKKLTPDDLLREITQKTELGNTHIKNFHKLIYKFFLEPSVFIKELEKVEKFRKKDHLKTKLK